MNIAHQLEWSAFHFPERIAVIDGDREVTYAEFNREAGRVAAALAARGVRSGDFVALCAPNSFKWLAFYFGALKAGAAAVTFSHLLTASELAQVLSDCRPKVFFTTGAKLADLGDRCEHASIELIVSDGGDMPYARFAETGVGSFRSVDGDRDDTAAVLYTGGTTGIPKGALLTHVNLAASAFNVARYERSTETDRALCFLPLNHVFAQVHILHSMVLCGGSILLQPGFDLDRVLHALEHRQVTKFYAVPTVYIRLLQLPDLRRRLSAARYCFSAAASMATEVVRAWKNATGLNIHEAYGMTESASMVTYNHYYRHVVGSVGTPVNLVEVAIRDPDGSALEPGRQGEICIRGPNIAKGYLNQPEETRTAFRDGWFRSGDIGVIDEDGYLYIVDRLKDMIITGGENVYPREVEEVLYTHGDVQECAVVGLPDPEYGERVAAFIVAREGKTPDVSALKAHLKSRLTGFKVPKDYIFVAELPKNNAGKLLKREIRERYAAPPTRPKS
ncbi:MAG: class I adenylate-forming enzyme family protein [Hyphomicrobiales bacterium]